MANRKHNIVEEKLTYQSEPKERESDVTLGENTFWWRKTRKEACNDIK